MTFKPIEQIQFSESIDVSVVIPHLSHAREENLKGLLEDIKGQTVKNVEAIIIKGVSPQGKAINQGARLAKGNILMVMDDDSRMGHSKVIENLLRVIQENPSVGMAGASIITPENANAFQKKAAQQFPRFNMPIVKEVAESDLPCHGCVAFPKDIFMKLGMERENILRGLDPDLRVRVRKAGYRVVLAPDTWAYHPLPQSFFKLLRIFIRNGYGSAYTQIFHPEINFDTDEKLDSQNFIPKRSFVYRILRYPVRLIISLVTFQWIRFLGYTVYIFGYVAGYIRFTFLRLASRASV